MEIDRKLSVFCVFAPNSSIKLERKILLAKKKDLSIKFAIFFVTESVFLLHFVCSEIFLLIIDCAIACLVHEDLLYAIYNEANEKYG